jgi:hypothetical protein
MRAYSCARISIAIVVVMVTCIAGVAISPGQGLALEPNYKVASTSTTGGASGGGEWKTDSGGTGELPVSEKDGRNAKGPDYVVSRVDSADASWIEEVQTAVLRMVRFVGAMFSQLY